jgi:hypothetical protein
VSETKAVLLASAEDVWWVLRETREAAQLAAWDPALRRPAEHDLRETARAVRAAARDGGVIGTRQHEGGW